MSEQADQLYEAITSAAATEILQLRAENLTLRAELDQAKQEATSVPVDVKARKQQTNREANEFARQFNRVAERAGFDLPIEVVGHLIGLFEDAIEHSLPKSPQQATEEGKALREALEKANGRIYVEAIGEGRIIVGGAEYVDAHASRAALSLAQQEIAQLKRELDEARRQYRPIYGSGK